MSKYPVYIELKDRRVVVIGATNHAIAKARGLVEAGARVVVIAKDSRILIRVVLLRDLNFKNEHIVKRVRLFPERGRRSCCPHRQKRKYMRNISSRPLQI